MMQETLALSPVAAIWSRTARCLSQPRRAGRVLALLALVALYFAVPMPDADVLDAKAFSWRRLAAPASRPLLVIWIRQPDDTPASELQRRRQYYEDLIFGHSDQTRTYPDQVRQLEPSIASYYHEVSGGKFAWRRAGFIGPLNAPVRKKSAAEIAPLALSAAATDGHFNFAAFDANH
jgi:hypothetical protein